MQPPSLPAQGSACTKAVRLSSTCFALTVCCVHPNIASGCWQGEPDDHANVSLRGTLEQVFPCAAAWTKRGQHTLGVVDIST